jgi:AraC-like DNA-binding protein
MKTITIPDVLNLKSSMSIDVYDYKTNKQVEKQQVLMKKNTLSFLQEGTKQVFFDTSSFSIDTTKFLLMKSGHCLMTEKLSEISASYRSVLFFFSDNDLLDFIRKYKLEVSTSESFYSVYSYDYDGFIKRFVASLLDISKLSESIRKNMLQTKFEEIMLYLIESKGIGFLYSLTRNNDHQTQKFIRTIETNQLNKLSVKQLSFLSNMSISTFKREFDKHYNSSPSKWFLEKRLEHASLAPK